MTPAQLDHLRRIDAHLKRLLEDIAAKRTPGRWVAGSDTVWAKDEEDERVCNDCGGWDPDFIASCAGNAEAGWKATRAAIATALNCESWDYMIKEMYIRQDAEAILESILAAFPNI